MEEIIKIAIEGGWKDKDFPNLDPQYMGDLYRIIVCDPLFWQALGKASGWDKMIPMMAKDQWWLLDALRFHEINLTEGWDKAVAYVKETTRGTALVN